MDKQPLFSFGDAGAPLNRSQNYLYKIAHAAGKGIFMLKKYFYTFLLILILLSALFLPGCQGSAQKADPPSPSASEAPAASEAPTAPPAASKSAPASEDTPEEPKTTADPEDSSPSPAAPSTTGKLCVSGTQLTGEHGEAVQLRGISTHGLAWFPDYVNEDCFSELKQEWNANVIRLAMYTAESGGYCTDGNQEDLKNLIRSGVCYAADQDLYVIVDWHILSDSDPNTYLEESRAFFNELSAEFAGQNHILYEICNEPNGSTGWSEIKSYAEQIIPVIRANDPDAVILIGTPNWSQYVDQAAADPITGYDNLMYSLHFYAATHKEDLRSRMVSALSAGLPIFVTEYGICDASGNGAIDISQADQWVAELNRHNLSYVAWNLSNKNESSALFKSSCTKTSGFTPEDLSESGQWVYQMLTGGPDTNPASAKASGADSASGTNSAPGAFDHDSASTPSTEGASEAPASPDGSQTFTTDSGTLSITLTIVNSWETDGIPYYQYSLSLQNISGSACTGWSIDLPFVKSLTFSDGWNGEYSVEDETLHITSKDYNGAIPAGESVSDIGFIIYGGKL